MMSFHCLGAAVRWSMSILLMLTASGIWAQGSVRLFLRHDTLRVTNSEVPHLLLEAQGEPKQLEAMAGAPALKDDAANPAAQTVAFATAETVQTGDPGRRIWRYLATVNGMPATTATYARIVSASWGTLSVPLRYTLTNNKAPELKLSVSALPTEWSATSQRCQRIRIGAVDARATGIGLTSTLVEESGKHPLSGALFLSRDGTTNASATDLETAVNDTGEPVLLCVSNDFKESGKFVGSVTISAVQKPDGQTLTTAIHHTTDERIAWGVALVLLGCVLALIFRFVIPALSTEAHALLPATLLRERAASLREKLRGRPSGAASITQIPAAIEEFEKSLDRKQLTKFVPTLFTSLFRAPDSAGYATFLAERANRLQVLQVLVVEGILKLDVIQPPTEELKKKIGEVDALAVGTLTPDQALTEVRDILTRNFNAVNAGVRALVKGGGSLPGSSELLVRLESSAFATLLAWVVLSFLSGAFVLVWNDPGFGAGLDYLFCLLWGFGTTVASSITTNPATSALGIKMPDKV